jgi:cyclopropane fatty-acyl-phospholipid synthase-like methyltransferase
MNSDKPFSQASANNRQPILEQLQHVLATPGTVLEIGTGTGQHAEYFAAALPHLRWQPSDHPEALWMCRQRLREAGLGNILEPLALDVGATPWPLTTCEAAFSANTAHIMAWPEVQAMFHGVAGLLPAAGAFCLYGPFNYQRNYTSDSNRRFDHYLQSQAVHMGIRDIADLEALATEVGMTLEADRPMPANNRLLVWRKCSP